MSFLKKLFGGSKSSGATGSWAEPDAQEEHEGYTIAAAPVSEGGQFRLAGTISKEIDGEVKTHQLIRADMFPNKEEAVAFTFRKAKQVIKEQGDRLFS
ncbi:HlyU family transcriptional regulator [Pseudahrensia aquimaris]|uniref:HlyU family transcriptional regulator n=1 Tax=Pseudahrensia aquimaris TaxID=744461 RepID=A0ABW3FGE5_9HYPH